MIATLYFQNHSAQGTADRILSLPCLTIKACRNYPQTISFRGFKLAIRLSDLDQSTGNLVLGADFDMHSSSHRFYYLRIFVSGVGHGY